MFERELQCPVGKKYWYQKRRKTGEGRSRRGTNLIGEISLEEIIREF
jgi:hypothetical protein